MHSQVSRAIRGRRAGEWACLATFIASQLARMVKRVCQVIKVKSDRFDEYCQASMILFGPRLPNSPS